MPVNSENQEVLYALAVAGAKKREGEKTQEGGTMMFYTQAHSEVLEGFGKAR
jgi:hypothetical protein